MNRDPTRRLTYTVLVVEPDPDDARRFRDRFDDIDAVRSVQVAADRDAALDCIYQRGTRADSPIPDFVLLGLDLPAERSYELVSKLKTDPDVRSIPVVAMSRADDAETVAKSYERNANAHVSKPNDTAGFDRLVRMLELFWFDTAQLPHSAAN
ncbi:response regulator [Natrinema amylolyticum]|uniref:response regulator n=1 Tax=Natrinema amylolyticum TaxID=2878679 RepID=UPI001CFB999B|nr:response regulator [Natrinema amylolyticum]